MLQASSADSILLVTGNFGKLWITLTSWHQFHSHLRSIVGTVQQTRLKHAQSAA